RRGPSSRTTTSNNSPRRKRKARAAKPNARCWNACAAPPRSSSTWTISIPRNCARRSCTAGQIRSGRCTSRRQIYRVRRRAPTASRARNVALLLVASDLGTSDHLLDLGHGVYGHYLDIRVLAREHAKYLVSESRADCRDTREIQHHASELIHALHQALALRTRDQIFVADLCQPDRNDGLGEAVVVGPAGIFLEHLLQRAGGISGDGHDDCCPRFDVLGLVLVQRIQVVAGQMIEDKAAGGYFKMIKGSRGEEHALTGVSCGISREFAFG